MAKFKDVPTGIDETNRSNHVLLVLDGAVGSRGIAYLVHKDEVNEFKRAFDGAFGAGEWKVVQENVYVYSGLLEV
jgi:hypothetical protein